jgi:NAD(P)-dependent dehydrogenase (short-subunit alcohol dehydrogenase family)
VVSRQGANVVLASPELGDLAYASDRLYAMGDGEILGLEADVRDPDQAAALVAETTDQYGGIDHLVTAPRPLEPGRLLDVPDEDWFRGFDRLFMSVVWTLREAHAALAASARGTVVNVTSPAVPALGDGTSLARAFGRAVESVTETQAAALAPEVRVNAVLPGPHETEDLEGVLADAVERGDYEDVESAWRAVLADCPYESPGDPVDLGSVVAFLSSDHAGFLNGATVPVDGGTRR